MLQRRDVWNWRRICADVYRERSGESADMLNLRKLIKNFKETGSLAEQCSVFSFINEWCFITKTGALGAAIEMEGIDYECLNQRDLDSDTKRLEAAFKLFGPEFRVYQYLFKSHFEPEPSRDYENPVVQKVEQERTRYRTGAWSRFDFLL
jgi:type IV secretory pathway VirB4 component